ncbi:hypothetical protein [Paraburkholderia tuberum]|uniref:hypothetical protein n=1 Tax=Paraburkholderia tuberum TaxID=157910 RepID=UPI00115FC991|nr:hypothetical protein [Paraburkholderia tuberum]
MSKELVECGSNAALDHQNRGLKKPRLLQNHPQVVTCATEQSAQCIANRSLCLFRSGFPLGLHIANCRSTVLRRLIITFAFDLCNDAKVIFFKSSARVKINLKEGRK